VRQDQSNKQATPQPKQPLIYSPGLSPKDEAINQDGSVKPHWDYLLKSVRTMGVDTLEKRKAKADRILRDDGATYNLDSPDKGRDQTWNLDLIPSVISSQEWGGIEAGLLERSECFNLLLRDLYGARQLITNRVIPPEALYAHNGFLRACQGIQLPGEHELILHGTDLIRDEKGQMRVLTDRTQSPSGAGFALENRTVMSRVFPSLFRDSHVHRLASFFQRVRTTLSNLAPHEDQPLIVVLTSGIRNEAYFEHAYLANYLGFHLVQSGDLVTRNGYVWMKSLDGLSRVDVILRRVDDWYCDPVELRSDSQYGVANLLNVARAGRVAIANPLGSGILENPILLKYLPQISKALMGRELRLKNIPTYWCGDKVDHSYVKTYIDQLIIKPISRSNNQESIHGGLLTNAGRRELLQRIAGNPMQWIAQPIISASTVPTYDNGVLTSRPNVLRSFSVASDSSYAVMPGGLTRVGTEDNNFVLANQTCSTSKDTWVIASEPERQLKATKANDDAPARETSLINLPSRVIENLFWLGRYAERTEASLRLLRTTFLLLNGEEPLSDNCRKTLLETVTEVTATQPGFIDCDPQYLHDPETELLNIIKDGNRMGSIRSNLNAMITCANESKEQLSSDTLRVINDIRDILYDLDDALEGGMASAPEEALDPLVTALMALAGLSQESMVRGMGWRFMDIGRRLERSLQTTVIINRLIVPEVPENDQNTLILAMLMTLEVLISYRRRNRARMGVQTSLDLVIMDCNNPRSVLYQVERLFQHVEMLPKANDIRHELSPEQRAVLEAQTLIKLSLLTELSSREEGHRKKLKNHLIKLKHAFFNISDIITDKYFDHRQPSQQLVGTIWEQDE